MTHVTRYVLITVRVLANVLIAVLLGLSTYVIQVCVDRSRRLDLVKQANKSYDAGFWAENEVRLEKRHGKGFHATRGMHTERISSCPSLEQVTG